MFRKISFFAFLIVLIFVLINLVTGKRTNQESVTNRTQNTTQTTLSLGDTPLLSTIAENLEVPWAIAFLPDGGMLVTERKGTIRRVDANGLLNSNPVLTITDVKQIGEGGLHGIVLHPQFESNHFVYLYYTYSSSGNNTLNKVVRYTFANNLLLNQTAIVDKIPGASNHDGGRIKFGPDDFLYITTGDAQDPSLAQNKNSLAGKILRVTDAGKPASGNPFINADGDDRVYSYGHRNPQGICWSENGEMWETEHGPSGIQSGNDELNRIVIGANYGWPTIQGYQTSSGMVTPIANSGTSDTWAPAGAACIEGSVYFGGLRGEALYQATITGDTAQVKEHFKEELGRIREVILGLDELLYISTSNRDGRGVPNSEDDKILRVSQN